MEMEEGATEVVENWSRGLYSHIFMVDKRQEVGNHLSTSPSPNEFVLQTTFKLETV